MNKIWAVVLLAGFISGISLRSFLDFGWAFIGLFVFLSITFFLLSIACENKKLFLMTAAFFFCLGFGVIRYETKDYQGNLPFAKDIGSKIAKEAVVVDEPDEKENYTRLVVEAENAKILVYAKIYPEFLYGDKIAVSGVLKRPQNFNADFDWQAYLAKEDIYFEMFYPEIEFISSGHGSFIKTQLFNLKKNFLRAISRVVPEPNSAFLGGITVGAKESIPKSLDNDFRKTGIIHVVVLSGYNVSLVADTAMRFFNFLPRIFGISLGMLGIVLFAIMTGASATVVRASIMAILVLLARATGRIYQITWALFLTGFFMILHNPKILRFDTSFQLSFLATLSLIYLAPFFEKKLHFVPEKFKLREIAAATLSAQIFVLPLLLYKMGIFSLFALPVNLLVLIFIPITMFFGFLTGFLGMLNHLLSVPFGWVAYFLTQYELFVVNFFARIPFSSFNISNFPFGLMLLIYFVYGIIIYKLHGKIKKTI